MSSPIDIDDKSAPTTRRRFLKGGTAVASGALLGAGAAAGAETNNLPPGIPEWMKAPGEPTGGQLYGAPSPFEEGVVKNISKTLKQYISASSRTPLQELDGIITPNGLFYERHHGGVPTIDPAQHRLMLHGLVERRAGRNALAVVRLDSVVAESLVGKLRAELFARCPTDLAEAGDDVVVGLQIEA